MTNKWTVPAWTYDDLAALSPCEPGFKAAARKLGGKAKCNARAITLSEAAAAGVDRVDIIWLATHCPGSADYERRLHLWAADCAAHVLPVFTAFRPADDRPAKAIEAARAFARGEIDLSALVDARNAASAAIWTTRGMATSAATAALYAAASCAGSAAFCAADCAQYATTAREVEPEWQVNRLILWMESESEPEVWPLASATESVREAA